MNVGGPAVQVRALTESLDPEAFETRLVVGQVEANEADYLESFAPNLPALRLPGLGRSANPVSDAAALGLLVREMRRFKPHIVHTHTAKAGTLGRLAARLCRVPVVVHTFHGHVLHGYFSARTTRWIVRAERVLAHRTDGLVAVGVRVRDDLLAAGIGRPEQYFVVPPGVDVIEPPPQAECRDLLGLPAVGPIVAFVGRLTAVKRPDRFIEVALALAGRHPDVSFAVAGDGELLDAMRVQGRALGDRLRFLSWRADVETVYRAADVVVLTSDNEGMPMSLIEAAILGVPAVATDVGSTAEVVIDGVTGLVTTSSPGAIADAAGRLLTDPGLRHRMGEAAAARARTAFARARLVADTERIYRQLATTKGLLG